MKHADVAGRRLHYVREGNGPTLLLIQGMSGNHLHWGEPLLSLLHPHFDVITYDHRGIGHSDRVEDPFTIADLADDAAGLLDALGVARAHVMGISMGGMTAQELVLRRPDLVDTLTIGCSYCGGPESVLTAPEVVMQLTQAMMSGDRERAMRTAFEVNVSPAYATDEHFATFREIGLTLPAALPVIMLQMQAIAAFDTSARLPGLDVPALVMHGDADRMLPVANGELIARLIPGARFERFDGAGHLFWWEDTARAARLLIEHAGRGA